MALIEVFEIFVVDYDSDTDGAQYDAEPDYYVVD